MTSVESNEIAALSKAVASMIINDAKLTIPIYQCVDGDQACPGDQDYICEGDKIACDNVDCRPHQVGCDDIGCGDSVGCDDGNKVGCNDDSFTCSGFGCDNGVAA